MRNFKIKISEGTFGEFECQYSCNDSETAIELAKEHYASELGTFEDMIEIVSIDEILCQEVA